MRFIRQFLCTGGLLIALLGCATITIGNNPVNTPSPVVPDTPSTPPPEATVPPDLIVIEGQVDEINLNIIVIGNAQVQIDINNPLLALIEVGDVIQLEGVPIIQNNIVIINVINIISIQKNIIIIDGGNIPLPIGCKITKKGNIKCTKKGSKKGTKK